MESVRVRQIVEQDGEIRVTGLPVKRGQHVDVTVQIEPPVPSTKQALTAHGLLHSGLAGLWSDREDIGDSALYARRLREQAQHRSSEP